MYERPTNYPQSKEGKKVHSPEEAANSKGVGTNRKRHSSSGEISGSSSQSIPLEKGIRARSRGYPQWEETQGISSNKKFGERKPIPQGCPCPPDSGTYAFKKRDELGLSNRKKGQHFSKTQRERTIEEVLKLEHQGISKSQIVSQLGICRSTYYGWLKPKDTKMRNSPPNTLLPEEREAIIHLLKSLGWIEPQNLR